MSKDKDKMIEKFSPVRYVYNVWEKDNKGFRPIYREGIIIAKTETGYLIATSNIANRNEKDCILIDASKTQE